LYNFGAWRLRYSQLVALVFAQEETPEVEATELPAPVVTRYGRGFGPGNGTCDGTCDADGDGVPDQLRLQDGTGAGMQYGHGYGPGDGTCDGNCDADGDGVPDQLRLQDGTGAGMQYGRGSIDRGQGQSMGQGFGPGNGQGMGQGMGLRDGSCSDDLNRLFDGLQFLRNRLALPGGSLYGWGKFKY